MKKRNTGKAFESFKKRNTHKRRTKERAKAELLRAVMETNVGTAALKIGNSYDGGRRERTSGRRFRDEAVGEGVFSSAKGGFGFVSVPEYEKDIFIPEGKTLGALEGDTVEVIYHTFRGRFGDERCEGRVRKILAFGRKTVVGTYVEKKIYYRSKGNPLIRRMIIPDDTRLGESFAVREVGEGVVGHKVLANLIRGRDGGDAECDILRDIGEPESKEANYEAILLESGIPTEFSADEVRDARSYAAMPLSDEGRVIRDEIIFTIDGEDAKDLDDAISLRKVRGGWRLGVHIADVSAYVPERTALDRAVMARGTSVYFTDKVVPMLPEALSNGACSLNAGEDKYALSAMISLDESGGIKGVEITPSIIRSRVRGVYSEVNKIFDGTADGDTRVKYKEVISTLSRMKELYLLLKERAKARGVMDLDAPEARIILDEHGAPVDVVRRERGDAEMMIEAFMLTANEAVARELSKRGIPCVYRVHDNPPEDKLHDFVLYAEGLGLDIRGIRRDGAEAKDFSALLSEAEEKGILTPVSYTMLRSMAKAKYSEIRSPHFGLSLDYYCHFTSPIRRLSDLATHRIIHKVLIEGKGSAPYEKYARRAAVAATEAELRAIKAERRIENLYKTIYMKDKVGDEYEATVSSVTSFGFFAELPNTCEGLVPISELGMRAVYDERTHTIRIGGRTVRIGDTVKIRVEYADVIRGRVEFALVE